MYYVSFDARALKDAHVQVERKKVRYFVYGANAS